MRSGRDCVTQRPWAPLLDSHTTGSMLGPHTLFLRRNSSSGMRLSSVFSFLEVGSSSIGGGGCTGGIGAGAGTGATGGAGTKAARTRIGRPMSRVRCPELRAEGCFASSGVKSHSPLSVGVSRSPGRLPRPCRVGPLKGAGTCQGRPSAQACFTLSPPGAAALGIQLRDLSHGKPARALQWAGHPAGRANTPINHCYTHTHLTLGLWPNPEQAMQETLTCWHNHGWWPGCHDRRC